MPKIARIIRKFPRPGIDEPPFLMNGRFKMANPAIGTDHHHAKHAIFKNSLEQVADGLRQGLSLWMKEPEGKRRETLICADSLIVEIA
jgi:hypothetical protein